MSRDIRSFFTVLSKKSGDAPKTQKPKKPAKIIDSDDDIIGDTPEQVKKVVKTKRRAAVFSSDSEDEGKSSHRDSAKKQKISLKRDKKPKLKPVNLDALNRTIKQTEVKYVPKEESAKVAEDNKKNKSKKKSKKSKTSEIGIHGDKDFEKTLEDLDEDTDDTILLDNLDFLDQTLDEAAKVNGKGSNNTQTKEISDKKESKTKSEENPVSDDNKHKETLKPDKATPKKAEKRQRKDSNSTSTPNKKQKLEQTDSGIDHDLEKWEKKRQSAGLYVAYLHRGAPRHHGEKEYPKGKPDCLKGLTIMRTGVLDSLEGEEFENLVTDHGGKVVHSVSKKVNYVVVGDEPGPAKLDKANKYKLPQICEDEFLDLILTRSGMKPNYAVKQESEDLGLGVSEEWSPKTSRESPQSVKDTGVEDETIKRQVNKELKHFDNKIFKPEGKPMKSESEEEKYIKRESKEEKPMKKESKGEKSITKESKEEKPMGKVSNEEKFTKKELNEEKPIRKVSNEDKFIAKGSKEKKSLLLENNNSSTEVKKDSQYPKNHVTVSLENLSWTDKYKPTSIKSIIGQQDTNSNMNKLKRWLENWFRNSDPERRKKLPKPSLYKQFDGAYFKAVLLSGPPGVGKTTTATLVAKELGFDVVEFNASDTRSKKLLHEEISHMMKSKTVAGFALGQKNVNQKRVLLMDEVDGMAGNEDRGGISELISFIKTANFPIVCMCNNRDLQKMKSLVNYCYELKFGKPNVAQVRGAMMSICFKEGLTIRPDALAQLITGTGCDIRQTLNHLSMWSAAEKTLSSATVQKESKNSQKDVVFGAWDVIRKVFNKSENEGMSLADKSRLFFYDYSFGPMFVQENYLTTVPECTGPRENQDMEKLIRAHLTADCLSRSDLIESKIRSTNNWSLLESQGFLCTVLPSHYMSGKMGQVRFPRWFGKNSQRIKSLRVIGELYSHARTSVSGDKFSIRVDYAEVLMNRMLTPLVEKQNAGVDDTLAFMESYSLLRDDLTNLCDLVILYHEEEENRKINPFDAVNWTVKAALTRKYNKTLGLKFAPPALSKRKKGTDDNQEEELFGDEEEQSEEEETEDNIDTDALIKVKDPNDSAKPGSSKSSETQKESKSKGKSTSKSSVKGKSTTKLSVKGKSKK